jgi:ornithine cyclodeaminase/alanine dehydrogenase-like protein (mu-crystallin family)
VLVAGTSREKADAFAREITRQTSIPAHEASPPDVSAAEIVATCTTSATPVVVDRAVQPGAHVNAIGAFTPQTRELPAALIARGGVYVDTRAGAFSEAGDLLLASQEGLFSLDAVRGEIGDVIRGRAPGRRDAREVTIYKSVGAAFLDAVTAHLAYERAQAAGAGEQFAFT